MNGGSACLKEPRNGNRSLILELTTQLLDYKESKRGRSAVRAGRKNDCEEHL